MLAKLILPLAKSLCFGIQLKPESWNLTVPQPQSLEKKENQHESSQAHIPTFSESIVAG